MDPAAIDDVMAIANAQQPSWWVLWRASIATTVPVAPNHAAAPIVAAPSVSAADPGGG